MLPFPSPYPLSSNNPWNKTPRARDGFALPPSLRDELERLVAEHVGDERAAVILADLESVDVAPAPASAARPDGRALA